MTKIPQAKRSGIPYGSVHWLLRQKTFILRAKADPRSDACFSAEPTSGRNDDDGDDDDGCRRISDLDTELPGYERRSDIQKASWESKRYDLCSYRQSRIEDVLFPLLFTSCIDTSLIHCISSILDSIMILDRFPHCLAIQKLYHGQ